MSRLGTPIVLLAIFSLSPFLMAFEEDEPYTHVHGDRRDPFTYYNPQKEPEAPPVDWLKKFEDLSQQSKGDAETALKAGQAAEALRICKEALRRIEDVKELERRPALVEARERILRLQEVAERQARREEAEAAFRALNLRLSGVVVSERFARAIINGQAYRRGEPLQTEETEADLRVEDILPGQVVVSFRGLKMPLNVSAK